LTWRYLTYLLSHSTLSPTRPPSWPLCGTPCRWRTHMCLSSPDHIANCQFDLSSFSCLKGTTDQIFRNTKI
jgi:hypothetical protein